MLRVGLAFACLVLCLPVVVVFVSGAQSSRSLLPERIAKARSLGIATTRSEVLGQHGSGDPSVEHFLRQLEPKTEAWRARTKNYRDAELAKLADESCEQILSLAGKRADFWLAGESPPKYGSAVSSIGQGLGLSGFTYSTTTSDRAKAQSVLISWFLDQSLVPEMSVAIRLLKSQSTLIQEILEAKISNALKARMLRQIIDPLPRRIDFARIRSAECGQFSSQSIRDGFDFIQVCGPGGQQIVLSTREKLEGIWFDSTAGSLQSRCGQTAWLTSELRESLLSDYLAAEISFRTTLSNGPTDANAAELAARAYSSQLGKTNWLMSEIAQTFLAEQPTWMIQAAKIYLTRRALLEIVIRQLEGLPTSEPSDFDDKPFRRVKSESLIKIYSVGPDLQDDGAPADPKTKSDDFGFKIPLTLSSSPPRL
jgi:hypothetical protein